MPYVDTEAALISTLRAKLGGLVVAELPGDLEKRLPVVQLTGLPGEGELKPWGGTPLVDVAPMDYDVFAATREQASDLATRVRSILESLHDAPIMSVEVSKPAKRPDFNPQVRRFGGTLTARFRT